MCSQIACALQHLACSLTVATIHLTQLFKCSSKHFTVSTCKLDTLAYCQGSNSGQLVPAILLSISVASNNCLFCHGRIKGMAHHNMSQQMLSNGHTEQSHQNLFSCCNHVLQVALRGAQYHGGPFDDFHQLYVPPQPQCELADASVPLNLLV